MFIKYNLLEIFKSFLKTLQLDKLLSEPKTKTIDHFALQVSLLDYKVISEFHIYAFFGNLETLNKPKLSV